MMKYFYCPSCNNIYTSKLDGGLHTKDDNLKYDIFCYYKCECGSDAVEIDKGLLTIIKNINTMKLKTAFCCEGHLKIVEKKIVTYSPAYIAFDNTNIELLTKLIKKYPLPKGWYLDKNNNPCIEYDVEPIISIRYEMAEDYEKLTEEEFEQQKQEYINDLANWVDNLINEESDTFE